VEYLYTPEVLSLLSLSLRCVDSQRIDAYVACTASMFKVGLVNIWRQHHFVIMVMSGRVVL